MTLVCVSRHKSPRGVSRHCVRVYLIECDIGISATSQMRDFFYFFFIFCFNFCLVIVPLLCIIVLRQLFSRFTKGTGRVYNALTHHCMSKLEGHEGEISKVRRYIWLLYTISISAARKIIQS